MDKMFLENINVLVKTMSVYIETGRTDVHKI